MKKNFLTKMTFLALAFLCLGTGSAWGAGYTATLSADYKLTGYKMKAFYNFTTNTPAVLPTDAANNNLTYRSGYGLYNFGSGTRSNTVSIPVSKSDIIVIQFVCHTSGKTSSINSISSTAKNETLSSSTGYEVYDVTADATSETWQLNRYGNCVSAVVMEKDSSAKTADYTIKYQDADGNTLKADVTYTGGVVVGATYTASAADMASFYNEGSTKKYIYVSGNETKTAAASGNVITLVFREAASYDWTVKNNLSENILYSGTAFEGDNVTVTYPYYINVEGTLYYKNAQSSEYHETFAVTENNLQHVLTYTASDITNVVYLAEGEDIFTEATGSNAYIRCSMEKGGYAAEKDTFTTIPAGKYVLVCSNRCGGDKTAIHNFYAGENLILSADGNGYNALRTSEEFTVTNTTEIAMQGGANNDLVDWVYIQKTGEASYTKDLSATGFASFSAPVNVTVPEGTSAYKATVSGSTVTLTLVEGAIPANAGVILYNSEKPSSVTLTGTTDAATADFGDNQLIPTSVVANRTVNGATDSNNKYYALNAGAVSFGMIVADITLSDNKAYLKKVSDPLSTAAMNLTIDFAGGPTSIENIEAEAENNVIYNVYGIRVNENYKGMVIVNGKKYINK